MRWECGKRIYYSVEINTKTGALKVDSKLTFKYSVINDKMYVCQLESA